MSLRKSRAVRSISTIHQWYLNRELSLLEFHRRVLEEAQDESNPLLERVKFLSIVGSNLDEFFMVRVVGSEKAGGGRRGGSAGGWDAASARPG